MAGAWAILSGWWGPENPWPLALTLALGLPAGWWLTRGGRTRGRIEVVDGSVWPWEWEDFRWRLRAMRELRTPVAMWPTIARAGGIAGAKLTKVVIDPEAGIAWHVELARGAVQTAVKVPAFTSAVDLEAAWVVTTPNPLRPRLVVIEELVQPPASDELHDDETPWVPRPAVNLAAERMAMLRAAVERLGDQPFSVRALAREASLPRAWVTDRLGEVVAELGLEQESNRMWRRPGATEER